MWGYVQGLAVVQQVVGKKGRGVGGVEGGGSEGWGEFGIYCIFGVYCIYYCLLH